MAKIHTVEWTPAILPHPVIETALRTNWHGLLGDLQKVFTGLNDNELLGGIPGSPTDHHGAPYSLTEEFVVGLPHALADAGRLRDPVGRQRRRARQRSSCRSCPAAQGRTVSSSSTWPTCFYSLGVAHPGALRLHNFPKHLQNLVAGQRRALRPRHRSTSCATASAACRATTSSAACCTRSRSTVVRGAVGQPAVGRARSSASTTTISRRWTCWSA